MSRVGEGVAGEVSPIKNSSITRCALFARQRFLLLQSKSGPAGSRPETASRGDAGTRGERSRRVRTAAPRSAVQGRSPPRSGSLLPPAGPPSDHLRPAALPRGRQRQSRTHRDSVFTPPPQPRHLLLPSSPVTLNASLRLETGNSISPKAEQEKSHWVRRVLQTLRI